MKNYQLLVHNLEDNTEDVAMTDYISQDESITAGSIIERIERHINHDGVRFSHGSEYVVIEPASDDEGYMYDVYESQEAYENEEESIDGGQCTGTLSDAIGMAIN